MTIIVIIRNAVIIPLITNISISIGFEECGALLRVEPPLGAES